MISTHIQFMTFLKFKDIFNNKATQLTLQHINHCKEGEY